MQCCKAARPSKQVLIFNMYMNIQYTSIYRQPASYHSTDAFEYTDSLLYINVQCINIQWASAWKASSEIQKDLANHLRGVALEITRIVLVYTTNINIHQYTDSLRSRCSSSARRTPRGPATPGCRPCPRPIIIITIIVIYSIFIVSFILSLVLVVVVVAVAVAVVVVVVVAVAVVVVVVVGSTR